MANVQTVASRHESRPTRRRQVPRRDQAAIGNVSRHFYMRQFRDMKLSPQIELMDAPLLGEFAALCGWVLARSHAKASGLTREISDYIGRGDPMADALVKYSDAYADQVERD